MATGRPGDESVVRMQFMLDLRRRGISDQAVLRAMDEVPREHFVESPLVGEAYFDRALPIACGQTISQPYLVAYMTEQLGVQPEHRMLEVGTGSGYQAAVLSRLAREVISIERYRTLADAARSRLATLGFRNVDVRVGRRSARRTGASALRSHHGDGRRRNRSRSSWSTSWPTTV